MLHRHVSTVAWKQKENQTLPLKRACISRQGRSVRRGVFSLKNLTTRCHQALNSGPLNYKWFQARTLRTLTDLRKHNSCRRII